MNAIIIDDERKARQLLGMMLAEHCPTVKVLADCEDLPSGVKAIKREKPDIVFLDIEMPGHSGLEILDFFEEEDITFNLVFTTAYSEYAINAFKMSAIDYLLKPIQQNELIRAVEYSTKKKEQIDSLKILQENLSGKSKKIVINQHSGIELLNTNDILFFKANGAYTEIHKNDGGYIMTSKNLKHFEDLLSDLPHFFRTQKSYIINIKSVNHIQKDQGSFFVIMNGKSVSVSNERVVDLLSTMKSM